MVDRGKKDLMSVRRRIKTSYLQYFIVLFVDSAARGVWAQQPRVSEPSSKGCLGSAARFFFTIHLQCSESVALESEEGFICHFTEAPNPYPIYIALQLYLLHIWYWIPSKNVFWLD